VSQSSAPHRCRTLGTVRTTDTVRTITSKELAAVFDVTDRHIRRLCAAGKLPHHRVGSSIRFTPGDQAAIEALTAVVPSSMAADVRHGSSGRGGHRFEGAA
jgi:excisionase family DNA binding protein